MSNIEYKKLLEKYKKALNIAKDEIKKLTERKYLLRENVFKKINGVLND